jgi:pyridoxamine 5'-phosphate oxidase
LSYPPVAPTHHEGHESVVIVPDPTDLAALRRDYESDGIKVEKLPAEPLPLWRSWLHDAEAADVAEINAMIVSTVDADGTPSSRTVLCKAATEAGFVFFTNYGSRKGLAIATDPRVSLLFPWHPLSRQVIVSGRAEPVPRAQSEAYFASRPRGAQISAVASAQSTVVPSRDVLEQRVAELEREYDGHDVPCPPHWGGYLVRPQTVEFWQGRGDRLHDRIQYRAQDNGWRVERLSP